MTNAQDSQFLGEEWGSMGSLVKEVLSACSCTEENKEITPIFFLFLKYNKHKRILCIILGWTSPS